MKHSQLKLTFRLTVKESKACYCLPLRRIRLLFQSDWVVKWSFSKDSMVSQTLSSAPSLQDIAQCPTY